MLYCGDVRGTELPMLYEKLFYYSKIFLLNMPVSVWADEKLSWSMF